LKLGVSWSESERGTENLRVRLRSSETRSLIFTKRLHVSRVKADLKDEIRNLGGDAIKRVSELENLKAELRRGVKELKEASEAHRREVATCLAQYSEGLTRTKQDVKGNFAKQDIVKPAVELIDSSPLQGLPGPGKQFAPLLVKVGKLDVPDGIISHLTKQCGGNVHDCNVVEVTSSSPSTRSPSYAAKNIADFETGSFFYSAYCSTSENVSPARNNWVCYDFKERMVVPTHHAIRSYGRGKAHLKSWVVEASMDGQNWWEADHKEDSNELQGLHFARTFTLAGGRVCRFIRLVQTGANHNGNDALLISAWEVFGSLLE
jgi:hypothetical protein